MELSVNGTTYEVATAPGDRLLDVLRGPLGLAGTKEACGLGECGACTVLVEGNPVMACLTLVERVRGEVTTVEGVALEAPGLGRAFGDEGGFQCGFCTSGQIVATHALLRDGLPDDDEGLRHALSGNLCRCTGYQGILRAARAAAVEPTRSGPDQSVTGQPPNHEGTSNEHQQH